MMEQMVSHWMFAMISGFDPFNDWYDAGDSLDADDRSATFLLVEQTDNQLRISSYHVRGHQVADVATTDKSGLFRMFVASKLNARNVKTVLALQKVLGVVRVATISLS